MSAGYSESDSKEPAPQSLNELLDDEILYWKTYAMDLAVVLYQWFLPLPIVSRAAIHNILKFLVSPLVDDGRANVFGSALQYIVKVEDKDLLVKLVSRGSYTKWQLDWVPDCSEMACNPHDDLARMFLDWRSRCPTYLKTMQEPRIAGVVCTKGDLASHMLNMLKAFEYATNECREGQAYEVLDNQAGASASFEGQWVDIDGDIYTIANMEMLWCDGDKYTMKMLSATEFTIENFIDGEEIGGHLSNDDKIIWNDENIWTRKQLFPAPWCACTMKRYTEERPQSPELIKARLSFEGMRTSDDYTFKYLVTLLYSISEPMETVWDPRFGKRPDSTLHYSGLRPAVDIGPPTPLPPGVDAWEFAHGWVRDGTFDVLQPPWMDIHLDMECIRMVGENMQATCVATRFVVWKMFTKPPEPDSEDEDQSGEPKFEAKAHLCYLFMCPEDLEADPSLKEDGWRSENAVRTAGWLVHPLRRCGWSWPDEHDEIPRGLEIRSMVCRDTPFVQKIISDIARSGQELSSRLGKMHPTDYRSFLLKALDYLAD